MREVREKTGCINEKTLRMPCHGSIKPNMYKNEQHFMTFDIFDFYPSITENLLDDALDFAWFYKLTSQKMKNSFM